ncbi:hypothetical protein DYB25_006866 [Aphanomyces astaci]|uniref:DDE-1 domain-containing protein n=1 Tax=Aphanomyces astaci TaxID=112090 RepID=A0A397BT29_APHAT|nr:hypothetical protein DYB36_004390 [Aphanomyces astaci]RHY22529.1 hypothetical protein DYB25_006866 [Aphanomyces astaci]RHY55577.1 hypothetical protein DYB34_009049 [Aphanomyces astaci]RHY56833.1 hypothetical protein DYB30_002031 [Aphanomyces astaci]RHY59526.1 hypothetical protein DYB38_006398 [Aphanomyces astaci]
MKHKNHVCGYQERHAVIQFVAAHGMIATLDRYYNKLTDAMRETQRKKICQWIAKTEHIECMAMSPSTAKKRCWCKPSTTLATKQCGGKDKERATAMLMSDLTGTRHPLFLVLRMTKSKIKTVVQETLKVRQGFGKRLWSSVEPLEAKNTCVIYGNPTTWWNVTISLDFLKFHFGKRPDQATKNVLLLWDDFSAHWTDEVVAYAESINVVL